MTTTSAAAPAPSGSRPSLPRTAGRRPHLIGRRAYPVFLLAMVGLLVFTVLLAVSIGSVSMPLRTVWGVMADHLLWFRHGHTADRIDDAIIWKFRAPRALLAVVVGAGLAVAGTVLQAIVRNPLAEPYTLGVVQGGTFGAVMVIALGTAAAGRMALSLGAFVGAMGSMLVVLFLGRRAGRVLPTRLILSGVAIGYLFSAATSYVELRMSDGQSLAGVMFWLLGTVASASWSDLGIPTVVVLVCTAWLLGQSRRLNALVTGEESAVALGVDVSRLRIQLLVVTSLLTGTVVAVAGGVGFVGLMVPHMVRMVVGADHRRVLVVSVLAGGIFMEAVDIGARTLARPLELPLTVITAVIGVPLFIWLMQRSDVASGVG